MRYNKRRWTFCHIFFLNPLALTLFGFTFFACSLHCGCVQGGWYKNKIIFSVNTTIFHNYLHSQSLAWTHFPLAGRKTSSTAFYDGYGWKKRMLYVRLHRWCVHRPKWITFCCRLPQDTRNLLLTANKHRAVFAFLSALRRLMPAWCTRSRYFREQTGKRQRVSAELRRRPPCGNGICTFFLLLL